MIRGHFRRAIRKAVLDPITKEKIYYEGCVDRWEKRRVQKTNDPERRVKKTNHLERTYEGRAAKLGCSSESRGSVTLQNTINHVNHVNRCTQES